MLPSFTTNSAGAYALPALTHALGGQSRTSRAAGGERKLPLSYNLLFILVLQPAEMCNLPS